MHYKIGLCIMTGVIIWINRPYECGLWPDISLKSHLEKGERVEADDSYIGEATELIECPTSFTNPQETIFVHQHLENKNEKVNKHMKN